MATVRPLHGVRYNRSLFDQIGQLVAPPYDTVATRSINSRGPTAFNIAMLENVHLDEAADPHQLAAKRYHDWRASHVLVQDQSPRFYVHDHEYRVGDAAVTRRGLLGRVRLARWDAGIVLPHEQTFDGPRRERLERPRAVKARCTCSTSIRPESCNHCSKRPSLKHGRRSTALIQLAPIIVCSRYPD